MKKELENLSKEELVDIAEHYHLYNPDKMNKSQLIKAILRVNNIENKEKKKDKEIITKSTFGAKLYTSILFLTILLLLIMTISQFFTRFYFSDKLFVYIKNDVFGLVLSLASLLWSLYVFYFYWKYKTFNIFMMINLILSIGYFIYFMINYSDGVNTMQMIRNIPDIEQAQPKFVKYFDIYKTMFYVWIIITGTLTFSIIFLILLKTIRF